MRSSFGFVVIIQRDSEKKNEGKKKEKEKKEKKKQQEDFKDKNPFKHTKEKCREKIWRNAERLPSCYETLFLLHIPAPSLFLDSLGQKEAKQCTLMHRRATRPKERDGEVCDGEGGGKKKTRGERLFHFSLCRSYSFLFFCFIFFFFIFFLLHLSDGFRATGYY